MKFGYVSIVGKPNVGKSSFLNALFNKKVSIVSKKAQTTRNAISNIYDDDDSQIIFIDTPGIHNFNLSLNRYMNKASFNSIRGADVTVLLFDASHKFDKEDQYLFDHLKIDSKKIIVLNKIDKTNIGLVTELKNKLLKIYGEDVDILEMSVLNNFNIDTILSKIKENLPDGEKFYIDNEDDEDKIKFNISELIREKILMLLQKEVPHSIFINIKNFENNPKDVLIIGQIIVEKDSQKAILIGKAGTMIKRIGIESRKELEKYFAKHVNLELTVSLSKNWRSDEKFLKKHQFLTTK